MGYALQCGQDGEGILSSAGRDGLVLAEDVGEGGVELGGADVIDLVATGFHFAGPADEEWYAMAAFVDVGLVPAPVGVRLVTLGDEAVSYTHLTLPTKRIV